MVWGTWDNGVAAANSTAAMAYSIARRRANDRRGSLPLERA